MVDARKFKLHKSKLNKVEVEIFYEKPICYWVTWEVFYLKYLTIKFPLFVYVQENLLEKLTYHPNQQIGPNWMDEKHVHSSLS